SVPDMLQHHDQIIVGTHRLRHRINKQCRRFLGFKGDLPQVGEKLLCLKNARGLGLRNGTLWTVDEIGGENRAFIELLVSNDDDATEIRGDAPIDGFALRDGNGSDLPGHPFAFVYAITCHKAQGSQWDSVLVYDESAVFRGDRWCWLYTAISRAVDRITVISW